NGTELKVHVPICALTGPITVVEPDMHTFMQFSQTFTVNDYRNTFGFHFDNSGVFDFNINFAIMKSEFGGAAVDIGAFGVDTGIPNPIALQYMGFWAPPLNGDGSCYGFCVTSLLLSDYQHGSINAGNGLPAGAAATVFNLNPNGPLVAMIQ